MQNYAKLCKNYVKLYEITCFTINVEKYGRLLLQLEFHLIDLRFSFGELCRKLVVFHMLVELDEIRLVATLSARRIVLVHERAIQAERRRHYVVMGHITLELEQIGDDLTEA